MRVNKGLLPEGYFSIIKMRAQRTLVLRTVYVCSGCMEAWQRQTAGEQKRRNLGYGERQIICLWKRLLPPLGYVLV